MELDEIAFEKVDPAGSSSTGALFFISVILVIAGIFTAFRAASVIGICVGLGFLVGAVAVYWRLLHVTPQTKYFRYCWINRHCIHYMEHSDPKSRVARYSWSEIEKVEEMSLSKDEARGLKLFLNRPGMREIPIYLNMASEDAEKAFLAVKNHLNNLSTEKPNSLLDTDASRRST